MRRPIVGLVVGLLVVVVAVVALGAGEVLGVVRGADPPLVAAAVLAGAASVVVRGEGFRRLRRRLFAPPETRFHPVYYGAHFLRLTLPAGAAGFPAILAYVLSRESDASFEEDLAVATAADLLGYTVSFLLAFVGLGLFVVTGTGPTSGPVAAAAVGIVAVLVVAVATVAVFVYYPAVIDRLVLRIADVIRATLGRFSDRVRRAADRELVAERLTLFHETVILLRAARRGVIVATVLTAVSWVLAALPLWLSLMAVGTWIPFAVVLFAVPSANLVAVVPLPGGLGGVELALGALLVAATEVAVPTAAAAVLLHRLATYWTPLLVGGCSTLLISARARRTLQ